MQVNAALNGIAMADDPTVFDLRLKPEHVIREKWDWALLDDRLRSSAQEPAGQPFCPYR